jgi:hypothetical protein
VRHKKVLVFHLEKRIPLRKFRSCERNFQCRELKRVSSWSNSISQLLRRLKNKYADQEMTEAVAPNLLTVGRILEDTHRHG